MSDLNEVLGHLLCEITRARVAADMEAVRIAKQYADDPDGLLRHFPVPRMRMPDLEVTMPVIVSFMPRGYMARVSPELMASSLFKNLKGALQEQKISVGLAEIKKLIAADPNLREGVLSAELAEGLSEGLAGYAGKLVAKGAAPPSAAESARRLKAIGDIIRKEVGRTLEGLPQKPVGIAVDARSQQIKELGLPGLCLNLKLSIKEDGLEMLFEDGEEGRKEPPALKSLGPE